jgi:hypothetical protein
MPPAVSMVAFPSIKFLNPAGVISNWLAGITPRRKTKKSSGFGVLKRVSITVTIGRYHADGLRPSLSRNLRRAVMSPCFKGYEGWHGDQEIMSNHRETLGKSVVLGVLLSSVLAVHRRQRNTPALIANSGASMSALLKAAIGESQPLTRSPSRFTQRIAQAHQLADSTVSRNIPERLSGTILNTCQHMNGTLRAEYHRVIIGSEQLARVISIHGGIIHR